MNTAGLNNSTGAYTGGSQEMNKAPEVSAEANAQARPGARENTQAVTPDNSYSGTGQTLVTSNGQRAAVNTKSTTTYSTPTVVQSAPTVVAPNTTATETTTVTTPVTTAEITTPSTSSSTTTTETTTTETTAPMTSSTQETTATTTPTTTTTHRRMHKD
jgi:hypothetical protein